VSAYDENLERVRRALVVDRTKPRIEVDENSNMFQDHDSIPTEDGTIWVDDFDATVDLVMNMLEQAYREGYQARELEQDHISPYERIVAPTDRELGIVTKWRAEREANGEVN
jgi:phenylalanine-4-hydroxylase